MYWKNNNEYRIVKYFYDKTYDKYAYRIRNSHDKLITVKVNKINDNCF